MYPLPEPPSEDEQRPPEPFEQDFRGTAEAIWWLAALVWIIIITRRILEEEEIQLRILYYSTKGLQAIARFFGSRAIHTEKSYNDLVLMLH